MTEFTLENPSAFAGLPSPETLVMADGARLFFRAWKGIQGKPVLIYFHGIEGHSLWFAETAEFLNQQGLSIYTFDRRGAGLNQNDRGHTPSLELLISDCEMAFNFVAQENPNAPIFLVGNCWGAKAAVLLAGKMHSRIANRLAGLILTSPAIDTKVDLKFFDKVKVFFSWTMQTRNVFEIPIQAKMFTENKRWLAFIDQDELRLKSATGSFFVASFFLSHFARRTMRSLTLPLLILQAGNDDIVDRQSVDALFHSCASQDKELIYFDGAAHSLDFEEDTSKYRKILLDWIGRH
jgi:alpha-beta hydrolase superfamily lysophospholipase